MWTETQDTTPPPANLFIVVTRSRVYRKYLGGVGCKRKHFYLGSFTSPHPVGLHQTPHPPLPLVWELTSAMMNPFLPQDQSPLLEEKLLVILPSRLLPTSDLISGVSSHQSQARTPGSRTRTRQAELSREFPNTQAAAGMPCLSAHSTLYPPRSRPKGMGERSPLLPWRHTARASCGP